MNRLELRKVLKKRPKKDLVKLVTDFKNSCPSIQINFDANKLNQEALASKLWSILLNLSVEHPDEEELCIEILKEEPIREYEEIENQEDTDIIEEIPFNPQSTCKNFLEILTSDEDFMDKWENSRRYSGFVSLIGINDIPLDSELINFIFDKTLGETELEVDDDLLIKYGRSQIENWEIELIKTLSPLEKSEINLILSFNLIIQGLIINLNRRNQKIIFGYDDIPLLKRVILAQYIKLKDNDSCDDTNLDKYAENINNIIVKGSSYIKLLPWSDFE